MATKTISLRLDAYERLRAARRSEDESFTQVVLRASWDDTTVTAEELLDWVAENGPSFSEEALDRVDQLKRGSEPPEDKWRS